MSRETLEFIPDFARQIPGVAGRFERSVAEHEQQYSQPLDFSTVYWRPPVSPAGVVESERDNAARTFDLPAVVSLTDHDTIEGARMLRHMGYTDVPLSFEWSVPYAGSMFHLGLHGIAPSKVDALLPAFAAYSKDGKGSVADLLHAVTECPETVVVFNHPWWDLTSICQLRHDANVLEFMRRHGEWIHGIELNGYRPWTENRLVLPLAKGFGLPLVGGGDRHGRVPNAIVNLTHATCFQEFAHELRDERLSHCVVLPEYLNPFVTRVIETACDVLRPDRLTARRGWQDRVFRTINGVEQNVRAAWTPPGWVHATVAVVRALNSSAARAIWQLTRADGHRLIAPDCLTEPAFDRSVEPIAARPSVAA